MNKEPTEDRETEDVFQLLPTPSKESRGKEG